MQWCDLSYKEINKNKVKLTVTYDMGWQKILSGSRYELSRGRAFIIGGISKDISSMVLYSKAYQNCDAVDKREKRQNNTIFERFLRGALKV